MQELIKEAKTKVDLLACPGLAEIIEQYYDKDMEEVRRKLYDLLVVDESYDVVVLGCTHYPLVKEEIQKYYPAALLIDGSDGVAKRVETIVEKMKQDREKGD